MRTGQISGQQPDVNPVGYKFIGKRGKPESVHPDHEKEAAEIDADGDHFIKDNELKDYLRKQDILRDPRLAQVDEKNILRDYKLTLQNKDLEQVASYHSYEELTSDLRVLAEKYPDRADLVSLGKSHEGRDIWALKITKKPSSQEPEQGLQENWLISGSKSQQTPPESQAPQSPKKPGILITGEHHAREWITLEVPLFAAKQLLENYDTDPRMKNRVDNSVVWVVPLVNPDGYEYSRTQNSWWRKNREPITQTADEIRGKDAQKAGDIKGYGIDLNRNYMDDKPENFYMYRPDGDTPGSTWDDEGASDRVSSDTYRGPVGGGAAEVKAMSDLQQDESKNIKAAIDFHSYGRMILYPMGHSYDDHAKNEEEYANVGNNMARIIHDSDEQGVNYRVMKSSDLYAASGSSEDFEYVNGVLGFTIELGRSFAPDEKEIDPIRKRLLGSQLYLIDYIIDRENQSPSQQPVPPSRG